MNTVHSIIELLQATSSSNAKIEILKNNADNENLKKVFEYALDPFKQFYIRKIPKYNKNQQLTFNEDDSFNLVFDMLDKLSDRVYTGNLAIEMLKTTLETVDTKCAEILEYIIRKDVRCGVAESTVNKVWVGLIKEFPVMLCSSYDAKLVEKIKFPAFVQLKADGMRFSAIVKDGTVRFFTRKGKEIDVDDELIDICLGLYKGKYFVLDGEMLVYENGELLDRKTGNGILNKSVKGTISDEEKSKINLVVWDVIDYDDFVVGKGSVTYKERFENINDLIEQSNQNRISIIKTSIVDDMTEVNVIFNEYLQLGLEGVILKDFTSKWEDRRSKSCIKFKGIYDADLRVIEVIEGEGRNKGKLGALKCCTEDGKLVVNVGSGFTDEQRILFFADEMLDKIVAVEYNEKIVDKHGKMSLFLPVFVSLRFDKTVANKEEELT